MEIMNEIEDRIIHFIYNDTDSNDILLKAEKEYFYDIVALLLASGADVVEKRGDKYTFELSKTAKWKKQFVVALDNGNKLLVILRNIFED